jgi:hypothetical protein
MKSKRIIFTFFFSVLFFSEVISQEKLLPNVTDNPIWFKDGKIGIGTSNPNTTLDVNGTLGVFGGHGRFYTNGLKHFNIMYNEMYPNGGTSTTQSRLEIGIAEMDNSYWPRAKKGDITFRIGGAISSGGQRLTLGTMYTKNSESRSYVALAGYYGHSGLVVHNNGSVTVGTNQKGAEDELFVNVKSRFTQNIYLGADKGIYSLHNDDYLLKDHANGNVTLSAAGGNLYLGYRNTGKILLREPLYDSSASYSILHQEGYINQTRSEVTNYFNGNLYLKEATSGSAKLHFKGQTNDIASIFSEVYDGSAGTRLVLEVKDDTNDYIQFRHGHHSEGYSNLMDLKKNEAVIYNPLGIGSPSQNGYMLTVNGSILTKEIKVSATEADWADFVFEEDYRLRPISEVEDFIRINKHLPDIPSAKEIETSGVNLAEMNKLLLQKVEELTLYVIELKKENSELQRKENVNNQAKSNHIIELEVRLNNIEQILLNTRN